MPSAAHRASQQPATPGTARPSRSNNPRSPALTRKSLRKHLTNLLLRWFPGGRQRGSDLHVVHEVPGAGQLGRRILTFGDGVVQVVQDPERSGVRLDHLPHVSTFIADWVADTFAELSASQR